MTLGDIIREYLETNTMTDFSRESGISRAYAYMLIKNKNNSGGKIVPSWETIQQVAKGVHLPVDDVVAKLDKDYIVTVQAKGKQSDITDEEMQIIKAYRRASEREQDAAGSNPVIPIHKKSPVFRLVLRISGLFLCSVK